MSSPHNSRWCASACCGARPSKRSSATPQTHPETSSSGSNPAPLISRYYTALSLGYLPSNDQLYAALHALAGSLEGAASAVADEDGQENATDERDARANGSQSTKHQTRELLLEGAQTAREVAKWLYGDVKGATASGTQNKSATGQETTKGKETAPVHEHEHEHEHEQRVGPLIDLSEPAADAQASDSSSSDLKEQRNGSALAPSASTSTQRTKPAARGNSNEQIQQLFWLLKRAYSEADSADAEVDLDVHLDLPSVSATKQKAQNAVKIAQQESSSAIRSLWTVATAVGVDEAHRLVALLVSRTRTRAAAEAERAAELAKGAAEQLRPEDTPKDVEEAVQAPDAREAVQDATFAARAAAQEAVGAGMHGQMPKQSSEQQDTWEDVFVRSLERMLRAAKESAEARRSVRTLLELFETWSKRLSSVQERVDRAASVSLQAADNPKEALQDAREEAGTAVQAELHNSQLDAELDISNEMWSRLNALGLAARQTLEGLAGGKSLHPIVDASTRAITALRKETETRQWLKELGDVVREAMGSPDASDDHDDEDDADDDSEARGTRTGDAALTEKLRALLRDFVELINKRPELSAALDELKAQLLDFADAIRSEPGLASLGRRFARMGKALQTLFESFGQSSALSPQGIIDAIRDAPVTRAVKAVVKRLLPTWQQVLKSVPLPRVEFTSDQADASVDDIRIPALNLIPEHVGLSLRTDYTYDRDRRSHDVTTNTDTNVRLSLAGFRLGIEDVSFWVEEKVTAPSPQGCCGLCGCFASDETSWQSRRCICQGPAAWFAYRESALLDLGLWKEGLKVDLDLVDAGQSLPATQSRVARPTTDEDLHLCLATGPDEEALLLLEQDEEASEDVADLRKLMEKAQELVDDGQRTHFFNVRNVAVDAGAFDFELRKSHHWILNSFFLRPLARPIVRLVLQRVVAALIEDTFERADKQAWDLHVRATRLARSREGTSSEGKAEWMDYVRVLMDNKAGKSRARRRLERKRRELMQRRQEREKDRQRREEEELARRSEQQERREIEGGQRTENRQTRQLRKGQTMRVTPTALIKSDTSGSYALSVGLAPRLLAPHKRGPSTKRTDLRDDLVQQNWKSLGQRPVEQAREGWEEAAEETDLLLPFRTAQEQVDNVRGMAKEVKRGNERIRREERQIDARQESSAPTASKGWKTDLFDL